MTTTNGSLALVTLSGFVPDETLQRTLMAQAARNSLTPNMSSDGYGLISPVDGGVLSKGWALRSSMESALKSNAILGAPLGPAPTWSALTLYYVGQCVRGLTAGSTTNVYEMIGNPSVGGPTGTSAAATGPTGTGSAIITDGTVGWIYLGSIRATGTYPTYSTVNPATSTDVMNGYLGFVNANNYAAMGLTQTYSTVSAAAPVVSLQNCNLTDAVTILPKNSGTAAAPSRNSSSIKYAARFVTNAKKWVSFGGNPLYQYSNIIDQIKINGQFLSEAVRLIYTGSLINPGAMILDLTSFPSGNKTIEIFGMNNFSDLVQSIAVQPGEFVYPLPPNHSVKIALEGDSITDMTGIGAFSWSARIEVALNEYLGCQNILNNAIGGTGLIANNSGTATTYIQRLPDIVAFNPDILIINGVHNDSGAASATRIAAMLTYLAAVRAALPNCSIGIIGSNLLSGDNGAGSFLTLEQDLATAYATFRATDKNCFFVPILTATPVLLSGSAPYFFNNPGGQFTDSHPGDWYYQYMNRVITDGVRKFISAR